MFLFEYLEKSFACDMSHCRQSGLQGVCRNSCSVWRVGRWPHNPGPQAVGSSSGLSGIQNPNGLHLSYYTTENPWCF
jgi:hypothetical protein